MNTGIHVYTNWFIFKLIYSRAYHTVTIGTNCLKSAYLDIKNYSVKL